MVSGSAAEMEAVARPDATGTTTPLLKVSMRSPHSRIVGHVIVGRVQFYLSSEWREGGRRKESQRRVKRENTIGRDILVREGLIKKRGEVFPLTWRSQ